MSAVSLVSRQAVRLGVILLVCAGIAAATSAFVQTPIGTAALTTLVRRGGPEGFQAAGPREGGGRLVPHIRAGLPEVLRSAGTMGLLGVGTALLLKLRKPTRRAVPIRARPEHGV